MRIYEGLGPSARAAFPRALFHRLKRRPGGRRLIAGAYPAQSWPVPSSASATLPPRSFAGPPARRVFARGKVSHGVACSRPFELDLRADSQCRIIGLSGAKRGANHPVELAHRMAYLHHLAGGRYRLGVVTLATGIGAQAGSRSAGSSGRPTSARIRWLIASVMPKVSH